MILGGDMRGYRRFGDGSNPFVTFADTVAGLANPAAGAQLVLQAQTPVQVPGPPIDYTPIFIGGGLLLLAALWIKHGRKAAAP